MLELKRSWWVPAIVHRVMANRTFRGVAMIGGGAALGQVVLVAATPVVSRLYGPQAYGALAVFSSLLSIASILVTFRFEVAIPLPEEDTEARDVLFVALGLAFLTAGLFFVGLLGWQWAGKAAHLDPGLKHLVWTLPMGMLGTGCYQTLVYWAIRKRLYRPISANRLNQSVASVGAQILLCRLPLPSLGLILGYIVGQAFGLRTLLGAFHASRPKGPLPTLPRLVGVGRKYWNLSAWGTATAIAAAIGDGLPSLLLAKAYGLEVAGVYMMASRVSAAPAQMVGVAVSQVFLGEMSQRMREDPSLVSEYFHSVHRNLRWVGAGVLVLGALSPVALPWVLGEKWGAAGLVAAILAPAAAADIMVRPLYNITVIANRPRLQMLTGLLPLGLSILGLGIPVLFGFSHWAALLSYSVCRCLGSWMIYLLYRNVVQSIGVDAPVASLPTEDPGGPTL